MSFLVCQVHSIQYPYLKERKIVRQKLGKVDIVNRAQHQNVLIFLWVFQLQMKREKMN